MCEEYLNEFSKHGAPSTVAWRMGWSLWGECIAKVGRGILSGYPAS